MDITQYQYRYGQAVAFLINGAIRFGNVASVITKQDKDGERTAIQVHIHPAKPAEGEPEDEPDRFLIPRSELIKSLDYPGCGNVIELAKHSEEYQRAKLREDTINNPPAAVPATVEEAPPQVDAAVAPASGHDDVPSAI